MKSFPKEKGLSIERIVPSEEDALTKAEADIQRIAVIIQGSTKDPEQGQLLETLATCGRLLERARKETATTERERLADIAEGIVGGSLWVALTPGNGNLVRAEAVDSVRRCAVARFDLDAAYGHYEVKSMKFLSR